MKIPLTKDSHPHMFIKPDGRIVSVHIKFHTCRKERDLGTDKIQGCPQENRAKSVPLPV